MTNDGASRYDAIAKGVFLVGALVVAVAFLHRVEAVLLLFALSAIIAIALTPIVNWLEQRKVGRGVGTILVLFCLFLLALSLYSLISSRLREEIIHLSNDFPRYSQEFMARVKVWAAGYPAIENALNDPNLMNRFSPAAESFLGRLGHVSLSLVTVIVGMLVTITVTAYMMANPRPIARGLLQAVPERHRDQFSQGLVRGSDMIVRWVWANTILGLVDGCLATIFLEIIGIPGAFVWGAVTLFAELIPQLGAYLMAVPPTIVALATEPKKALWVIAFYIGLQQLVNHLLAPLIRARTMRIHPISEIFAVLSLTVVFGVLGAIIADPVLGFVKAFYDAFYGEKNETPELDGRVEALLRRELPRKSGEV